VETPHGSSRVAEGCGALGTTTTTTAGDGGNRVRRALLFYILLPDVDSADLHKETYAVVTLVDRKGWRSVSREVGKRISEKGVDRRMFLLVFAPDRADPAAI